METLPNLNSHVTFAFVCFCLLIIWCGMAGMFVLVFHRLGLIDLFHRWKLSSGARVEFSRICPWDKEIALVTGGSNGIGWILANRLADRGVCVYIWDIVAPPGFDSVAGGDISTLGRISFMKVDISDPKAVSKAYDSIKQTSSSNQSNPISILVNNAGICMAKDLLSLTDNNVERTFGVNTMSHFWIVRPVLRAMIERRHGHIITVASTMGLTGVADMTDYCASKAAAVGFHDSLRQELNKLPQPHLIHTTLLCPGLILTGMFRGIRIKVPFLVPPLYPETVVERIMGSLEDSVLIPKPSTSSSPLLEKTELDDQSFHTTISSYRLSLSDCIRLHKVIWIPSPYFALPLLNILLPTFLFDGIKFVLGGNQAVTEKFIGRN